MTFTNKIVNALLIPTLRLRKHLTNLMPPAIPVTPRSSLSESIKYRKRRNWCWFQGLSKMKPPTSSKNHGRRDLFITMADTLERVSRMLLTDSPKYRMRRMRNMYQFLKGTLLLTTPKIILMP